MIGGPIGSPIGSAITAPVGLIEQTATILLAVEFTSNGPTTKDGQIIRAISLPWIEIVNCIQNDPDFLSEFAKHPRKFEEFIAATYDKEGWDEVILTPRSNDKGRDVIAIKHGFGSVRFLEQTKAYSPGHLVSHDDVRAVLGVMSIDQNASKAIITTTSDFAPGILRGDEFNRFMPNRLELRNGKQLAQWLNHVKNCDR
jgi:restriction system protein